MAKKRSSKKHRAASFHVSPSLIARYFFHDCERFLRFSAATPQLRKQEAIPKPTFDHSPIVKALLESGYQWEQIVLDTHLNGQAIVAPGDGESCRNWGNLHTIG